MYYPCKECCRRRRCDHFQRCKRWCAWFAIEWRKMKELFDAQPKIS